MDVQSIQNVIEDKLRLEGITGIDVDKTIFGIATIGLIIGKDKLIDLSYDSFSMETRKHFENDVVLSKVKWEDTEDIKRDALNLISKQITPRLLSELINILVRYDLLDIVLHMEFLGSYNSTKENDYPISSVSWINSLVTEIIKKYGGKAVLNTDCGFGVFMEHLAEARIANTIKGYSFNILSHTISKIRGYFSPIKFETCLVNSFYAHNEEKFDIVYNSYPATLKYNYDEIATMIEKWDFKFVLSFNKKYSPNMLWILNSLQSIKPDGIVVALVPNGVLFNSVDADIRKYLIDNKYLNCILSLPSGILPFTNIKMSLIILKKNNTNMVRLIDASDICQKQRRHCIFSEEDIKKIIELFDENSGNTSFEVPYEDIVKNDFYFGISRYTKNKWMLVNPCVLENVTKSIFRGYQIKAKEFDDIITDNKDDTEYRIINISDVNPNGFIESDLKAVVITDTRRFSKYCVEDGDVIITAKNTTIKTAVYKSDGTHKDILTGNLIAIRSDQKKINPYYLKAFLDGGLGVALLESIKTGTTVISISPNSLKRLVISLLPMEIQNEIAEEYIKTMIEVEEILTKYKEKSAYLKKIYDIKIEQHTDEYN